MLTCLLSGAVLDRSPLTFNKNFEGGSLGKIEKLDDARFRCSVSGQHDERGRNRQATWYYFRMDGVANRDVTLTLTDLVGEYNDQPGACPMSADIVPVFSYDNEHWQHFPSLDWDDQKKEGTLRFRPEADRIWIAHAAPYTHARLLRLLDQLDETVCTRIEVIGKTVQKRELHLITVSNFEMPDSSKKTVWLQARQHAWESGTSYVLEGALRFITSNDPRARQWRDKIIFKFTPMMDPDGCVNGQVRFNANGYDVNRHWDAVDLRQKQFLEQMPEIWYVKKAIFAHLDSGHEIALFLNLHNTETAEYADTQAQDRSVQATMQRFFDLLVAQTTFDPSRKFQVTASPGDTTSSLWSERRIPVMLMEQRIGSGPKLGRRPTAADRLAFGRQLVATMAESVLK